jgi:hypothetical protein
MQWYASLVDRKNLALRTYLDAVREALFSADDEVGLCLNLGINLKFES